MKRLFFDIQSGAPLRPEVFESMEPWLRGRFGNPSSQHQEGLEARDALESARRQAAAFLGAQSPDEVIFTSNGTEALNLAILGAAARASEAQKHIVTTPLEHPSVSEPIRHLESQGFSVTRVPVELDGRVSPESIRDALTPETFLIATHWGHHEFGTLQPVAALGELALKHGVELAIDAVSSAGFHDVRVPPGVSMMAVSPQRFGGPRGVGFLYARRGTRLSPRLLGGAQEFGLRAGTENVAAIAGGGRAAELAALELPATIDSIRSVSSTLWNRIEERVAYVKLNGPAIGANRLPHLVHVSVEFVEGEALVLAGDFAGLALSSGHLCANKSLRVSPSMQAIGLPYSLAVGSVLFSVARDRRIEEAELAADRFAGVVAKVRGLSGEWEEFERGKRESAMLPSALFEESEAAKALRLKRRSSTPSLRKGLPSWEE